MIFSSVEYVVFFTLVLLAMLLLRSHTVKKLVLLFSCIFFYGYWDYRFVILILLMIVTNYFIGTRVERQPSLRVRKMWLAASVVFNLTLLGFFKYYNFFIHSADDMLGQFGVRFPLLDILLPVGISFVTFEVMSYVIDIYRGQGTPNTRLIDFALLVLFFPHLIAGPILKPSHFLPQLQREITIKWVNVQSGVQIFVFGLIKKILIADRLALFVDPVFARPEDYSSLTIWCAVLAYAIQIYCDFSGYTDMAIGSAKCLGFDIPANFRMPYLSGNITEFWRRWHISLSTWLREYLYFSLGGNRKGKLRQYVNLFLVMLLGGLWHGASWNFVIWGGLHGAGLIVHKAYYEYVLHKRKVEHWLYRLGSLLVTFGFVCLTWVFFRSSDFGTTVKILRKMFLIGDIGGVDWIATSLLIIAPLVVLAHLFGRERKDYVILKLHSFPGTFVLCFVLQGLVLLAPVQSSPFIYFQF